MFILNRTIRLNVKFFIVQQFYHLVYQKIDLIISDKNLKV